MVARIAAVSALLVAAVLTAVVWLGPTRPLELTSGHVLDTPRVIDEFELIDHHGEIFSRSRLTGQWSLVFIGFTHCPDVCPTTLALLGQLDRKLRADGHELQTIFVSVDPERDTPQVLAEYAGFFGERILAATGDRNQLGRFCDDLGFAWVKVPLAGGEYTVDHSGALALIDQQARVAGYFTPPFELDELAVDLESVLNSK